MDLRFYQLEGTEKLLDGRIYLHSFCTKEIGSYSILAINSLSSVPSTIRHLHSTTLHLS